MSSSSRNFIIHAVPFLETNLDEKSYVPAEVVSLLATSSSFMNGSFAPEMVMQNKPELTILQLLQNFSSTLQFVTSLELRDGRRGDDAAIMLGYYQLLSQQINSLRYFTRQLVRLDVHHFASSDTFNQCLPFLRALRSFSCSITYAENKNDALKQENDLVAGLQHLDLDELNLKFWLLSPVMSPTLLERVWKKNRMPRLRSLEVQVFLFGPNSMKYELALSAISDFHPNLYRLRISASCGKLTSLPDFSVMNDLEELALYGSGFGARESELGDPEQVEDLSGCFLSPPPQGLSTYCSHLTKLELSGDFPTETLKFLIQRLGNSDHVKSFALGEDVEENCFMRPEVYSVIKRRSPSERHSTHLSCDVEYLDLLIERYPLLHFLHLGECSCLTEKQLQMISDNMTCLRALILPVEDARRIKPGPVLSTVRDLCTRNSNTDPVFEYLLLPYNIKFGLQDVVSAFGRFPATSNLGLKRLHASYSLFDTIDSFRSFLSHFRTTLEFISLPVILKERRDNDHNEEHQNSATAIDCNNFSIMPNLKEIYIDAEQFENYSYSALVPLLVDASPRLEVLTLEYPQEHDPYALDFGNCELSDPDDLCCYLAELFHTFAAVLNKSSARRDFLTVILGNTIASLCSGEAWTQLAQIKSLRRVLVSATQEMEDGPDDFPSSGYLMQARPDVMTNFTFSYEDENPEQDQAEETEEDEEGYDSDDVSTRIRHNPWTTYQQPTSSKKKKDDSSKQEKTSNNKSIKKTVAGKKKTKVAPKKATKSKKPAAKKTTSTKKKPTAKKKPVTKKTTRSRRRNLLRRNQPRRNLRQKQKTLKKK